MAEVYSVASLAEHWGCGTDTVYAMIRSGDLVAFKLGGRLLRIREIDVEHYEARAIAVPHPARATSQPTGLRMEDTTDLRLERLIDRRPNAARALTSALRGLPPFNTKDAGQ